MIIRKIVPKLAMKRVAAYARVSTLTEAQEESYETQVEYYTRLVEGTEGWELAGIYADQGITGTKASKRPQFMKMIQDAKDGKIDIILCKSISRFSRNAGEAQLYVHDLKSVNVEVRFEKEGINTFDASSDFIFGLYASLAQEESRSISENVKWAYRRLAEQGIRHVGNNHMLGYDEVDGKLTPNNNAWIVRLIFEEYAAGIAPSIIIRHLKEKGARRMRSNKDFTWSAARTILKNEAYVGDRILQKDAPQNYLTKKPDHTEAYDSMYIYGDHEGIITPAIWDAVQERMKRTEAERAKGLSNRCTAHFLYGKVICSECGQPYRRYTVRNGEQTYKTWRCRNRVKTGECRCRHVKESELLFEISRALGWDWNEGDSFDSWAFQETVEKVLVCDLGVKVILSTGSDFGEQTRETT